MKDYKEIRENIEWYENQIGKRPVSPTKPSIRFISKTENLMNYLSDVKEWQIKQDKYEKDVLA